MKLLSEESPIIGTTERPQAYIQPGPGQFPVPNQTAQSPFSSGTRALVPISVPTTTTRNQPILVNYPPTMPPTPSGRPLHTSGLVVPDIPITLSDGSTSHRRDSWRIAVRHWLEGNPAHGLFKPLKDWTKAELSGPINHLR